MRHTPLAIVLALLVGCSTPVTAMIDPSAAEAATTCSPCPVFDGSLWDLGTSTSSLRYPIPALVGVTFTEWVVTLQRDALGPTTTVRMQRLETVSLLRVDVGPVISDSAQGPGYVSIGAHIPPEFVLEDETYSLLVTGGGIAGDHAGAAAVYGLIE